jgi:hypothetical protein
MTVFSFAVGILMLLVSAYWMYKDDYGRANWFAIMAVANFMFALR